MLQPIVRLFQFQPFLDYAPPVRAGRHLSRRDQGIALLCRLAGAVVLLATGVGAFVLARDYGFGWTGVGLGALGLAAPAARGRRTPLSSALKSVLGFFALLLRIASLFCLTVIAVVALQCADPSHRPRDAWLLLSMLAAIPAALELLRALLRWGLGGDDELAGQNPSRAGVPAWREPALDAPDRPLGQPAANGWLGWSWADWRDDGFIGGDWLELKSTTWSSDDMDTSLDCAWYVGNIYFGTGFDSLHH